MMTDDSKPLTAEDGKICFAFGCGCPAVVEVAGACLCARHRDLWGDADSALCVDCGRAAVAKVGDDFVCASHRYDHERPTVVASLNELVLARKLLQEVLAHCTEERCYAYATHSHKGPDTGRIVLKNGPAVVGQLPICGKHAAKKQEAGIVTTRLPYASAVEEWLAGHVGHVNWVDFVPEAPVKRHGYNVGDAENGTLCRICMKPAVSFATSDNGLIRGGLCKDHTIFDLDELVRPTRGVPPPQPHPAPAVSTLPASQAAIAAECDALKAMLLEKNEDYGDSALHPVRIFSKASPEEQILVRIDDKVNRIIQGKAGGEDVTKDLIGYFILLRVKRRLDAEKVGP